MYKIEAKEAGKCALSGIDHFCEKFGISASNDANAVQIAYGKRAGKSRGSIEVYKNDVTGKLEGWMTLGKVKVPLFEKPKETRNGKPLAFFEDENGRYPCASEAEGRVEIGLDVFSEVGMALSGSLESFWTGMDRKEKERISSTPFVDVYEKLLFDSIERALNAKGLPLIHKSFWPNGEPFALCLTHDVDEIKKSYQYLTVPLKIVRGRTSGSMRGQLSSVAGKFIGKEPYWTFDNVMKTEERLGVKSTFFFLYETAPVKIGDRKTWKHYARRYNFSDERITKVIKDFDSGGWEVGLHASFESYNDGKLISSEKELLEKSVGHEITGNRQHNLNLEVPQTFNLLSKAGIRYDTSLGHKDSIGFRWGTSFPFDIVRQIKGKGLLEIPLAIMDINLFREKNVMEKVSPIASGVQDAGGVLTLLWHHTLFNDNEFPGWTGHYEDAVRQCMKKDAWIAPGRDVYEWWSERRKSAISCSVKGNDIKTNVGHAGGMHTLTVRAAEGIPRVSGGNASVSEKSPGVFMVKAKGDFTLRMGG